MMILILLMRRRNKKKKTRNKRNRKKRKKKRAKVNRKNQKNRNNQKKVIKVLFQMKIRLLRRNFNFYDDKFREKTDDDLSDLFMVIDLDLVSMYHIIQLCLNLLIEFNFFQELF